MRRDLVVEHLRAANQLETLNITDPLIRTESTLFIAFHSSSAATNLSVMDLEILQ